MIHLIGNAHLDPAWMWTVEEGMSAFAATCRSALDRIDENPDFIFTCSSAAHYQFIERTDATLFARIQHAVHDGRWAIVGGWWIEADCNLPSGESFVRQALLGQRYFQSRFGNIATVGYNVDSFGHNANLPALLKSAGMDSYVFMRPEQHEKRIADALFRWIAPDGTSIITYRLPLHYSTHQRSIREKIDALPDYPLYNAKQDWMLFYGVGNHGGGPTIEQLRQIQELRMERSDLKFSEPERFLNSVPTTAFPVLTGELQPHAIGCYSAHSEIKRLNRLAESMLTIAERTSVMRSLLCEAVGNNNLHSAWENVCFNQFHDLLGGVAIQEACDEVISTYREAIAIARRTVRENIQTLAGRIETRSHIESLIVVNTSAFAREEVIEFELWHPYASERGDFLTEVRLIAPDLSYFETQQIEASGKIAYDRVRFAAKLSVPMFGWRTFGIERHSTSSPTNVSQDSVNTVMADSATMIANRSFAYDSMESEIVIANGEQLLRIPVPMPVVFDDPSDTWSHGLTGYTDCIRGFDLERTAKIESGPLRHSIRLFFRYGNSRIEQEVIWNIGEEGIRVRIFLNWQEQHKLVKLQLRHNIKDAVARYAIPYASIERPLGTNEWPGQRWVDVANEQHGIAMITDSKYSYSVDEEFLSVTCARSPLYAHHVPPHELHGDERLRYLDQGEQEFELRIVPHAGDWSAAHLDMLSEQLTQPLLIHHESRHEGNLPSVASFLECDAVSSGSVGVGAIKPAEDGNGIIVRLIEQEGRTQQVSMSLSQQHATIKAEIGPFAIRSFLILGESVSEVDFLERVL